MALANKFIFEQYSKTKLLITEQTGIYDAVGNTTGFGVDNTDPNPDISDIQDIGDTKGIVFYLETIDGAYTYDITADIQARDFPNTNGVQYVLESSYFGLEKYPDGPTSLTIRYSGQYEHDDGLGSMVTESFVSEYTQKLFAYKISECCVEKLALAVESHDGVKFCDEPSVKVFRKAKVVFDRMKIIGDSGNYNLASEILTEMQSVCAGEGACNGC